MVYETFLQEIKSRMELALGERYQLSLHKVPKNNGLVLDGLCISKDHSHIAPALYLNPLYEEYTGGRALEDITLELLSLYRANETPPPLDYKKFTDFQAMKPRIACRLIHRTANEALLKEIPYIPWLDLALVFYICLDENENSLMTAAIHNTHIKLWNISAKELYHLALDNTRRRFPPVITSMARILEDLNLTGAITMGYDLYGPDTNLSSPFYVLTNIQGINGAVCLLYPQVLKNFAEEAGRDIIILPSSIHEVLLLPDNGDISCEEMSRLVTQINRSEVPGPDRLSNQVYYYSRNTDSITIASHSTAPVC